MAGGESSTGSGGSFRSRIEYFLYSGDKKHVFAGIAIISVIFGAPWFFMNRGSCRHLLKNCDRVAAFGGAAKYHNPRCSVVNLRSSKHQSHQDYMEKADKARRQRLSSGQPPEK